jgi:hypothetical protein
MISTTERIEIMKIITAVKLPESVVMSNGTERRGEKRNEEGRKNSTGLVS